MELEKWIDTVLGSDPAFDNAKRMLTEFITTKNSEEDSYKNFYALLAKVNIPESERNMIATIIMLLNFTLKEVDIYEKQTLNDNKRLPEDILCIFTSYAIYPQIIKSSNLAESIKLDLCNLFNDILLNFEAKKPFKEDSETRRLQRNFYCRIYAPVITKCIISGIDFKSFDLGRLLELFYMKNCSNNVLNQENVMNENELRNSILKIIPEALNLTL